MGARHFLLRGLRQSVTEDMDLWSYDNNAALDLAVQAVKRKQVRFDFLL
jgi:hypothetical protein